MHTKINSNSLECKKQGVMDSSSITHENSADFASAFDGIESSINRGSENEYSESAHRLGHDPWYQLAGLLLVAYNCGYVLGYSNLILKPLGWSWGITSMILTAVASCCANCFIASLHIINGKRFHRYRDLMGCAFGMKMYYVTWFLQFGNFILLNMGFLLLAGSALKEIHLEFNESASMTLQEYIIISGGICFIFSSLVPTLSSMRIWGGISFLFTVTYVVIVLILSIRDGRCGRKSYKVTGESSTKTFNGLNAIASLMFAHNTGMIPELQATLEQPVIKNMWKVLAFQFSVGILVLYGVIIIGYWAYGSSVSPYILNDVGGPKWAKFLANAAVFLQTIISQQTFCTAIHETLDTKFCKLHKKQFSLENIYIRGIIRAVFYTINTFFAAMLPFLGDFVSLVGSFSLIPLSFIFPSLIYIKVKGETLSMATTVRHSIIICFFSLLMLGAVISSIHSIIHNAKTYHLFANV